MRKIFGVAGAIALSITPPVWSKGDNALPPSPVWEEEMILIAEDPLVAEMNWVEKNRLMEEDQRRMEEDMRRRAEQWAEQSRKREEQMDRMRRMEQMKMEPICESDVYLD